LRVGFGVKLEVVDATLPASKVATGMLVLAEGAIAA
jgi:hypothetical protein